MFHPYMFHPPTQLRLGANPDSLKWYQEAELTNGRWAMAAVVGILFTDLVGLPKFWEAGAQVDLPFGGLVPLIAIEIAVFAVLEAFRYDGWKRTGKVMIVEWGGREWEWVVMVVHDKAV